MWVIDSPTIALDEDVLGAIELAKGSVILDLSGHQLATLPSEIWGWFPGM
jgi:hypothetical protein